MPVIAKNKVTAKRLICGNLGGTAVKRYSTVLKNIDINNFVGLKLAKPQKIIYLSVFRGGFFVKK